MHIRRGGGNVTRHRESANADLLESVGQPGPIDNIRSGGPSILSGFKIYPRLGASIGPGVKRTVITGYFHAVFPIFPRQRNLRRRLADLLF